MSQGREGGAAGRLNLHVLSACHVILPQIPIDNYTLTIVVECKI